MTTACPITFDVLDAVIAGLDRTQVNPVVPGNCAYTSETDPNHHCIVGQIWLELGRYVPGPNEIAASVKTVVEARGEAGDYAPGVVKALLMLQVEADNSALKMPSQDRTWASAIDSWPQIKRQAVIWARGEVVA